MKNRGNKREGERKRERQRERGSEAILFLLTHSTIEGRRGMCAVPWTLKGDRNGEQPPMDAGALDHSAMALAGRG